MNPTESNRSSIQTSFLISLFATVLTAVQPTGAFADGGGSQESDAEWSPVVTNPEYRPGDGPVVMVDAGHGNYHTIDGRFSAFAQLLNLDGYITKSEDGAVTSDLLEGISVYVISNAVFGGEEAQWILPTRSAFDDSEIDVIVQWVEGGGSLLLIADHMPFPGATAKLADKFGVVFINGYAKSSLQGGGILSFERSTGSLADHAVTRGRSTVERINSITSFTGQAFRIVGDAMPLMLMPDDWTIYLPTEANLIGETTPHLSTRGLVQGAVLEFGKGRVAIFGEAAMFTAQTSVRDGREARTMGLNNPRAEQNSQFVLNVMHWLTRAIDD